MKEKQRGWRGGIERLVKRSVVREKQRKLIFQEIRIGRKIVDTSLRLKG